MAMIMLLGLSCLRTARTSQWPLFRENVARRELRGTRKSEIFAHRVGRRRRGEPRFGEATARIANPPRHPAEATLFCQIFGDRTDQGIKPVVPRQHRLFCDRLVLSLARPGKIERVEEFGQRRVLLRTGANAIDGLSEGIRAHPLLPPGPCSSA